MLPNIFLAGKAGSGKDTVGKVLSEEFGYKRVAIADNIKNLTVWLWNEASNKKPHHATAHKLCQTFNFLPEPMFINDISEIMEYLERVDVNKNADIRPAYQKLGEIARKRDPDIWLRMVKEKIKKISGPVVITDGRYLREQSFFEEIRFASFVVVAEPNKRMERLHKRDPGFDASSLDHPTEQEVFHCPKIYNNGSIEDLRQEIVFLVRRHVHALPPR